MKLITTTITDGVYTALLKQAVTGSIIELGSYYSSQWYSGLMGIYLRNADEYSYVDNEGRQVILGNFPGVESQAGPTGLYLSRDSHFSQVLNDGSLQALGYHPNEAWGCGRGGVYLLRDEQYFLLTGLDTEAYLFDAPEEVLTLGWHGFSLQRPAGLHFVQHIRLFDDGSEQCICVHPTEATVFDTPSGPVLEDHFQFSLLHSDGSIQYVASVPYEVAMVGRNGIVLQNGNQFSVLVIK